MRTSKLHSKRIKQILLAGAVVLLTVVGTRFRLLIVSGSSMLPALTDRQFAVLQRQTRNEMSPRRGDIVVFRRGSEYLVKRVYAIAGDTVQLVHFANGATCVAGDAIFPWAKVQRLAKRRPGAVTQSEVRVPPGCVFVLGDNNLVSYDSRAFGAISIATIIGRVLTPRQAVASIPSTLATELGRFA